MYRIIDIIVTDASLQQAVPGMSRSDREFFLSLPPSVQNDEFRSIADSGRAFIGRTIYSPLASLLDETVGVTLYRVIPPYSNPIYNSKDTRTMSALSSLYGLLRDNASRVLPALSRRAGQSFETVADAWKYIRVNFSTPEGKKLIAGAFTDVGIAVAANYIFGSQPQPALPAPPTIQGTATTVGSNGAGAALTVDQLADMQLLISICGTADNVIRFRNALGYVTPDLLAAYTAQKQQLRGI